MLPNNKVKYMYKKLWCSLENVKITEIVRWQFKWWMMFFTSSSSKHPSFNIAYWFTFKAYLETFNCQHQYEWCGVFGWKLFNLQDQAVFNFTRLTSTTLRSPPPHLLQNTNLEEGGGIVMVKAVLITKLIQFTSGHAS